MIKICNIVTSSVLCFHICDSATVLFKGIQKDEVTIYLIKVHPRSSLSFGSLLTFQKMKIFHTHTYTQIYVSIH